MRESVAANLPSGIHSTQNVVVSPPANLYIVGIRKTNDSEIQPPILLIHAEESPRWQRDLISKPLKKLDDQVPMHPSEHKIQKAPPLEWDAFSTLYQPKAGVQLLAERLGALGFVSKPSFLGIAIGKDSIA